MCLPQMRRHAKRQMDQIIEISPIGIVALDADLHIDVYKRQVVLSLLIGIRYSFRFFQIVVDNLLDGGVFNLDGEFDTPVFR